MFPASVVALLVCLAAFIAEGYVPFSMPISLLGDSQHLFAYRLVVSSLILVGLLFVGLRLQAGDLFGSLIGGVVTVLLIALLVIPNHVRGHDQLAAVTMVATSVMSFGVAQRLGNRWLLSLTAFSLLSCSMLFTGSLVAVGIVEAIVLATAVFAMNVAERETIPASQTVGGRWYFSWRWPSGLRLPWWWRPGMGAGLCWGVYCLLVGGICHVFDRGSVIAGPVVLVSCSYIGFIAWREEMFLSFRVPLVFGGYALVMSTLSTLGAVTVSTGSLAGQFVLMGATAVVMVFTHLLTE